jgi:hypothetical protein
MFRHTRIAFLGAALAATLAACYAPKPAASVSALSYQLQPVTPGDGTRATGPTSAALAASPAPAQPATDPVNDPMRLFDMP